MLSISPTGASGRVSGGCGGPLTKVAGIAVSLLANVVLFFAAFRLMSDSAIPHRDLRWGTVVASLLWTFLQSIAAVYLHHASSSSYGVFAAVIPLIIWLHLGGQVFMYSAEVNSVVSRRLWPRSFFGDPTEPADKRARRALAKVEERSHTTSVDVSFDPAGDQPAAEPPATSELPERST